MGGPDRRAAGVDADLFVVVGLHRNDRGVHRPGDAHRRAVPLRGRRGGGLPQRGPRALAVVPGPGARPGSRGAAGGLGDRRRAGPIRGGAPDPGHRLAADVRGVRQCGRRLGGGLLVVVSRRPRESSLRRPGGAGPHRRARDVERRAYADPLGGRRPQPQHPHAGADHDPGLVQQLHLPLLVPEVPQGGATDRPDRRWADGVDGPRDGGRRDARGRHGGRSHCGLGRRIEGASSARRRRLFRGGRFPWLCTADA